MLALLLCFVSPSSCWLFVFALFSFIMLALLCLVLLQCGCYFDCTFILLSCRGFVLRPILRRIERCWFSVVPQTHWAVPIFCGASDALSGADFLWCLRRIERCWFSVVWFAGAEAEHTAARRGGVTGTALVPDFKVRPSQSCCGQGALPLPVHLGAFFLLLSCFHLFSFSVSSSSLSPSFLFLFFFLSSLFPPSFFFILPLLSCLLHFPVLPSSFSFSSSCLLSSLPTPAFSFLFFFLSSLFPPPFFPSACLLCLLLFSPPSFSSSSP